MRKRVILTIGIVTVFASIYLIRDGKIKLFHEKPKAQSEADNLALETDDRYALEALMSEIDTFNSNVNLKYIYSATELLAGKSITGNYSYDQLEDIYGDQIPSVEGMKEIYTQFKLRTIANYTYAVPGFNLNMSFSETENAKLKEVEDAYTIVNEEQMNNKLNKEDIKTVKDLLNEIYSSNEYSDIFKDYVMTLYTALEHVTAVPEFKFTDEEKEKRKKLENKYACKVMNAYQVKYEQAVSQNAVEDYQITISKALNTYFGFGEFSFLEYVNKYFYNNNLVDISEVIYRDRTDSAEYTNSSNGDGGNGTETDDKQISGSVKDDKKTSNLELQQGPKNDSDFNAKIDKDAKKATANYLNIVTTYAKEATLKLCKKKGYDYVKNALDANNISVIINLSTAKEDLLDGEFEKWLGCFKNNYKSYKDKEGYYEYYFNKISKYMLNTQKIKVESNGKKILPFTWAVVNGINDGLAQYLFNKGQTVDPTPVVTTVPDNQMEDAINDVPVGQDTNIFYESQSEYWQNGWIGDDTNNTVTNPNVAAPTAVPTPAVTPAVTPGVVPILDLTDTQTYQLDENGQYIKK